MPIFFDSFDNYPTFTATKTVIMKRLISVDKFAEILANAATVSGNRDLADVIIDAPDSYIMDAYKLEVMFEEFGDSCLLWAVKTK